VEPYVAINTGPNTTMGNARVQFNKFEHWDLILKTFTPVGYVALQTSPDDCLPGFNTSTSSWVCSVCLPPELRQSTRPFLIPITLRTIRACGSLKWLQNHPSQEREFRLIYVDRSHTQLAEAA